MRSSVSTTPNLCAWSGAVACWDVETRAASGALQCQYAGQPCRAHFQPAENLSCRLFIERIRIGYLDGTVVHRTQPDEAVGGRASELQGLPVMPVHQHDDIRPDNTTGATTTDACLDRSTPRVRLMFTRRAGTGAARVRMKSPRANLQTLIAGLLQERGNEWTPIDVAVANHQHAADRAGGRIRK